MFTSFIRPNGQAFDGATDKHKSRFKSFNCKFLCCRVVALSEMRESIKANKELTVDRIEALKPEQVGKCQDIVKLQQLLSSFDRNSEKFTSHKYNQIMLQIETFFKNHHGHYFDMMAIIMC